MFVSLPMTSCKASARMWTLQNKYYNNISTHFCFRSLSVSSSKEQVCFSHRFILDNIVHVYIVHLEGP